jgi:asparagine synthase (glutamine-hydrolysing)
MYFKKAPSEDAFHDESNRLIEDICFFDSLRADRCISSQGLEARVPYSDHYYVKLIQSIPPNLLMSHDKIEKYILRKAFDGTDTIPDQVLWRSKEALSDGVSEKNKSWYEIIQEHVDKIISDEEFAFEAKKYEHNTPPTKESYYYRKIFHQHYYNDRVVPYFWLPKWCERVDENGNKITITDPSARTLKDIYVEQ